MTFGEESLAVVNRYYAKKKTSFEKLLIVLFVIFSIYIYACLLFFSVFYQVQVIGPSMKPTFNINLPVDSNGENSIFQDIAVVNRYETGKNNDIVLIQTADKVIIKRIIAIGGQTLMLKKGTGDHYHYYLNGVKLDERYLDAEFGDMNDYYYNIFKTKFENDELYKTDVDNESTSVSIVIPKSHIFALGDNRKNSTDSTDYGAFNLSQIKGKVSFYYTYDQTLLSFLWQQFVSIFTF